MKLGLQNYGRINPFTEHQRSPHRSCNMVRTAEFSTRMTELNFNPLLAKSMRMNFFTLTTNFHILLYLTSVKNRLSTHTIRVPHEPHLLDTNLFCFIF